MIKPTVTFKDSQTVLSYNIPDFSALKQSVDQLFLVLRKLVSRAEFFKIKNDTHIRVETPDENSLRLHFIIPTNFKSPEIIHTVIDEYAQAEKQTAPNGR